MAKLGIQQTRGKFRIKGIVTGTSKDNFIKEIVTKSQKPMRLVNFGVEINKGKTVYVSLNGMVKDDVYFSKTENNKTETKKVRWSDRNTFQEEGFRMMGITVGLTRGGDGKNVSKILAEYDACSEIADNLSDGMSVFIEGNIEHSEYNGKHSTKYVVNKIYLAKDIDFEAENFEPVANFEQTMVLTSVEKNESGDIIVNGKSVGYSEVADIELEVSKSQPNLAKTLHKLKPYTSLKVFGNIEVRSDVTEVEVESNDAWGTSNPFERVNGATERVLVITGADRDSVDTDTYNAEMIDEAIVMSKTSKTASKDYGKKDDDWGDTEILVSADEVDEW